MDKSEWHMTKIQQKARRIYEAKKDLFRSEWFGDSHTYLWLGVSRRAQLLLVVPLGDGNAACH